jgi:zinc protease
MIHKYPKSDPGKTSLARITLLTLIFSATILSSHCQQFHSLTDTLPADHKAIYGKLKNERPINKILFRLVVKVGYPQETKKEIGISHFIEHLGFRRTVHFPKGLRKELEQIGLARGTDFGGNTGDNTSYRLTIPSRDSSILNTSLMALYDLAAGQSFLETDVNDERTSVLNEKIQANTEGMAAIFDVRYQLLGLDKEFQRSTDAEIENIRSLTPSELKEFYDRWYIPSQQLLLVVGDVEPLSIERRIKEAFNNLDEKPNQPYSSNLNEQNARLSGDNHRFIVIRDPNASDIEMAIYRAKPAELNILYPSTFLELKAKVIDDLFNRLIMNRFESIDAGEGPPFRGLFNSVERRAIIRSARVDVLGTKFRVATGLALEPSVRFIITELYRIALWGFSEEEIKRAKKQLRYQNSIDRNESASLLSSMEEYCLNNSYQPMETRTSYLLFLDQISGKTIQGAFGNWLTTESNVDITLLVPSKSLQAIPTSEQMFKWLEDLRTVTPPGRTDLKILSLPYLPQKITPKKYSISHTSQPNELEMKLANGLKVTFMGLKQSTKGTRTNEPEIFLLGFRPGGASKYPGNAYPSALAAAAIQSSAGFGNLNSTEFAQWKRQKGEEGYIGASPYVTYDESGIKGGATINNFEDLLNLVYLFFTQPRKDSAAFTRWVSKEQSDAVLEQNPFEDSIANTIYLNERAYIRKDLKQIEYQRSYQIFKELFSTPSQYNFLIVGFFEPATLIELTNKYLGEIPAGNVTRKHNTSVVTKRDILLQNESNKSLGNIRATFAGDSVGNVRVRLLIRSVPLQGDHHFETKLEVLNEVLKSALFYRLREREKGVYSVISTFKLSSTLENATFDIDFETATNNVDLLVNSAIDEMRHIAMNDFDKKWFDNALSIVRSHVTRRVDDPFYLAEKMRRKSRGLMYSDAESELNFLQQFTASELAIFTKNQLQIDDYALFKLL